MYKFIEPELSVKNDDQNHQLELELQPLIQGFATTLGNSLRRVLLSVMPGTAVCAFKIQGATQEFQTLPGISENVLEIGLNVEKIILQANPILFENEEFITLEIEVQPDQKVICAGDIKPTAGVEIINPDLVLANIVKIAKPIKLTLLVRRGYGYVTFVRNQRLLNQHSTVRIGYVTVNSQFSPIRKVFFRVVEIRVGEDDILEKLILGIETNHALSARDCLKTASSILVAHLQELIKLSDMHFEFKFQKVSTEIQKKVDVKLEEMDFSERTINALSKEKITTLTQLEKMTKKDILAIKNLGQKSLKEIEEKLEKEYNIIL